MTTSDVLREERNALRVWDGPRCVMCLVWGFLWPLCPKDTHPLDDLNYVADVQACVPPCFLRDRLPTLDSELKPGGLGLARLYQLFPPNPFRRGNPYLPMSFLHPSSLPWSMLPTELLRCVTKAGYRELKTYRAHAERRLCQHYNRPITNWNTSYIELFWGVSRLDFRGKRHLKTGAFPNSWNPLFEDIAEARYLTAELP